MCNKLCQAEKYFVTLKDPRELESAFIQNWNEEWGPMGEPTSDLYLFRK
uniref:Uncharacterized protein n=1 Tax=Anguilla anguilla TaxID=7936 RepID=A0A0E9WNG9_ANGAN